ncbi:MAG: hypothetical protein MAG715_00889 [Methanonatronarchaeales archaeon]|nr:hypothetical protein [Methanonatronarchaeales archaeon]
MPRSTPAGETDEAGSLTGIGSSSSPGSGGDVLVKNFSWSYADGSSDYTLSVPEGMHEYYIGRPRAHDYWDWGVYVTDPHDDEAIASIAGEIQDVAAEADFSERETVDYAISFVQSLEYTPDDVTTGFDDYPRYPVETLVARGGDCEDSSVLMASILGEMGYGVVLIVLPGHVAVGVKGQGLPGHYYSYGGERYYYLETTGEGWGVGELPEVYRGEKAEVIPLTSEPVLVHDWDVEELPDGRVEVRVKMENLGSAPAEKLQVLTALEAPGEGEVWSRVESGPARLEPGQDATYTAILEPPSKGEARILVRLLLDGEVHDESYSDWVSIG